jgi:hypothetical protein
LVPFAGSISDKISLKLNKIFVYSCGSAIKNKKDKLDSCGLLWIIVDPLLKIKKIN